MKIGIIGQGFVGNAIYQKFKNYYNVVTYDLKSDLCNSTFEKVAKQLTIFVCFFMILSGIILGLFDFFSSQVIQFIIEMS